MSGWMRAASTASVLIKTGKVPLKKPPAMHSKIVAVSIMLAHVAIGAWPPADSDVPATKRIFQ